MKNNNYSITYLEKINIVIKDFGIEGIRVCFEQATWNSSDGKIKSYFHVHFQHDELPDLNIGVRDSSFENLLQKVAFSIIPEIKSALKECYISDEK